jgi:mono/diheme cytochrome c family protein
MNSSTLVTIHLVSVTVFLVLYFLKTLFLLLGKTETLDRFMRISKYGDMIFGTLFLVTGIWLMSIVGNVKMFQMFKLMLILSAVPVGAVAFKKKNKALAVVSFVMLLGADALAEIGHKRLFPIKHVPEELAADKPAQGKFLYEKNCGYCHGTDGKKIYRDATDLSLSVSDASVTEAVVRNGRNKKMPAYGSLLNEDEIKSLTDYLMTLRN